MARMAIYYARYSVQFTPVAVVYYPPPRRRFFVDPLLQGGSVSARRHRHHRRYPQRATPRAPNPDTPISYQMIDIE